MDEAERLCHRLAIMDHGRMIAAGAPRELIAQHIEPQVVEVFGDGADGWAGRRSAGRLSERCENTGETVFCYAHDAAPLIVHDLAAAAGPALPAPPGQSRRCVSATHRARPAGLSMTANHLDLPHRSACASSTSGGATCWSGASWRIPSMLGNLADPMIYMLGLGYGLGRMLPDASAACRTSPFSPPAPCARAP